MPSQGKLIRLDFSPGINRNLSEYQNQQSFIDGDKVRVHNESLEKLSGWQTLQTTGTFHGVARDAITWVDLVGDKYWAAGTNSELALYYGGTIYDITPVRTTVAATSVFSTVNGDSNVRVAINSHGAVVGDYVYFTSASAGTLDIKGVYAVTSAATNTFDFTASANAGSTVNNDGAAGRQVWFLLASGLADNTAASGYGTGSYGSGAYGIGGVGTLTAGLRNWSLDTWGEDLIANVRNGGVYIWDKTLGTGARAIAISGAPTRNNFALVTEPTRNLMLFGTCVAGGDFDPLQIRWSANEDYTLFSAAVTNAAGGQRLKGGQYIQGALQTNRQIFILTDEGAHTATYVGPNYYWSFEKVGSNCGAISPQCMVDVGGIVFWMGHRNFYLFDGTVKPIPSSLNKAYFEQDGDYTINWDQKDKVFCGVDTQFGEIIWLVPTGSATEINRYVIYNYRENLWYDGTMDRTTWVNAGIFEFPLATTTSATIMEHDIGHDADGQPLRSYIQTGFFAPVEDGNGIAFVDQYIPDVQEVHGNNLKFYVITRQYPNGTETTKGPYTLTSVTTKVNLRSRGREISLKWDVSAVGTNYELGYQRLRIAADGER